MRLHATFCAVLMCVFATVPVAKAAPPRLMLATIYETQGDVTGYRVSEKLDGVRGRWDGRHLVSRGGLTIDAPTWFTHGWPDVPMDGELWIGRGRFDEVSGVVRAGRSAGGAWKRVRFMVFDLPRDPGTFEARVMHMRALLGTRRPAWLQAIPQFRVNDADELDARLAIVVGMGGEGLVLQRRSARYRIGRSDDLLKYKPYLDAEARVVAYTHGRGKYAGMTGALVVERGDGLRFRLGSGLSDAQRARPPPLGSHVTYRYNGITSKGVPRFARFVRVRRDMPPPDPR